MVAYTSRSGWGASDWRSGIVYVDPAQRTHFLVHYHGGKPRHDRGAAMAREVEGIHFKNGWSGIGYNFLVGQDGNAFEGRGWNYIGAHCPGMNTRGFGVYVAVGVGEVPTDAALRTVRALYDEAKRRAGHALHASFHGAHFPTSCAGDFLNRWVRDGMPVHGGAGATTPPKATKPPAKPVAKGKVATDGILGPDTYRAMQKAIGTTADGTWGQSTRKALQRHLGVTADGIVGPGTIIALQRAVGASVDGIWGVSTTKALQKALNAGKFTQQKASTPKTGNALVVDGVRGPTTYRAIQKATGAKVDGLWGPDTIRALQKHLRVRVDGVLGASTIKALQRKVKVTADGVWDTDTTKALQQALRDGIL